ncbi:carboxypeptidase regulatory-like domain-containing protein [Agrobacterium tumefaciens]|nr:carboxypeptidase regulatory-like domain-containing protein [Agrobacterium tumefaciens]NTE21897.1 carboxypeptidase regulatory-like domain-containing protein [Agrobacterium tumefaciens]
MKKLSVFCVALILSSILFVAFTFVKLGGIVGRIGPGDAAISVSLIAGQDTTSVPVNQGSFSFTKLKEGVYTLVIKANAPYKDAVIENVAVKDSTTTDMGEVRLKQ